MKPARKVDHERLPDCARPGAERRLVIRSAWSIRKARDAYLKAAAAAMEPSDGEIDLLVDYATDMLLEFNTVLCHLENPARFLRLMGDELEGRLRCGGKYHDVSLKAFKKASAGRGLSVHPVVRASEVRDAIKQILYEAWLREGKTRPYTVPSTRTVKRALKSEGLLLCDTPGKAPRR